MPWDIFCKVIDNHGDAGVCWRLCRGLSQRGVSVRLWIDDPAPLAWMAPRGHPDVTIGRWNDAARAVPGEVVIEAFACDPEAGFLDRMAAQVAAGGVPPVWINLEYLTAETLAERNHGLPSPVMSGPARGLTKHFFYPGFTPRTGGLLRETELAAARGQFDRDAWLDAHALPAGDRLRVGLFCYEPPLLASCLAWLASLDTGADLLVTPGRSAAAVAAAVASLDACAPVWNASARLRVLPLPWLDQDGFDCLLWACDLNFVRGEDSLVRALWAGKPFVWQIYAQDDDAHHAKLEAFLDWLGAPPELRAFHRAWNGIAGAWSPPAWTGWQDCAHAARHRLEQQEDLVSQLLDFVARQQPG